MRGLDCGWPMAMTLEELEKRVAALEQEVAQLKQERNGQVKCEAPDLPMLQRARASQPKISAAIRKAFAEMGVSGEPIGAEEVQKLLLAEGIDPTKNEFSRGIIAMREE